jgi:hypothetical protein
MEKFKQTEIEGNVEKELEETYLNPTFIKPLKDLGYSFLKYGHVGDDEMGTHILVFQDEITQGPISPEREKIHKENFHKMVKICTQDDDSQPHATYRYYMGTLFLYIPYFA